MAPRPATGGLSMATSRRSCNNFLLSTLLLSQLAPLRRLYFHFYLGKARRRKKRRRKEATTESIEEGGGGKQKEKKTLHIVRFIYIHVILVLLRVSFPERLIIFLLDIYLP